MVTFESASGTTTSFESLAKCPGLRISKRVERGLNTETESESSAGGSRWADVGMLAVAVIWGLNMPIMKFALGRVDPYAFNAVRLLISALVLAAIIRWQRSPILDPSNSSKPLIQQMLPICAFAFFAGFAYQILFLIGMDRTTAGNTALIMSAIPMWTAIMARILIQERLRPWAWVGLTIALAGTMVVTLAAMPASESSTSLIGNLIVGLAALCWSFGTVLSRPLLKHIEPLPLAFWALALSTPFHFLIAGNGLGELGNLLSDPWLAAAILYSGALSTGIAYVLWNQGIRSLGTAHASIYQNLVPIVALVAAWFLIGEIPVALQIIGGLLIITGVVVMRKNRD